MSNIAVIRTGGKQYLVKEGDTLRIEKLAAEGSVTFEDVLLTADAAGEKVGIGAPRVSAGVQAKVVRHGRADKVRVVHFKPKVRHHKVYGHKQPFTEVKIATIG